MKELYGLKQLLCEALEEYGRKRDLSSSSLQTIDTLAHACKNVCKIIEACEEEEMYSMDGGSGMSRYGNSSRSNRGGSSYYSNDGYYYDGGGMSSRRGRGRNGRFVSRDGGEMANKLREMMEEAPDANTRNEIQRLAEKLENM